MKNLEQHPLQRGLSEGHVTNLLENEWGTSLATIISTSEKTAIHVIVEPCNPQDQGDITPDLLMQLSQEPEKQASFRWLVFSGQHRIEVLKRRLEHTHPDMNDILEHPRAEWYAKVYKPGMILCFGKSQLCHDFFVLQEYAMQGATFKLHMATYNVPEHVLGNSIPEL